jgi:hypothetical protein
MILCADTEHTITEDRKSQASKVRVWQTIYPLDDEEKDTRLTIAFAGAGHGDWIAAFIQGIDRDYLMNVPDGFDLPMFEGILEQYNQEFFQTYIRAYAENPNHRPQTHVLVLTQFSDGRRAIFHAHENIVLKAEMQGFMAVGAGAPVFEGLAKLLLGDFNVYKPKWTMKEAASISIYIMEKVKSEVPGCGGNSHFRLIGRDGEQKEVPTSVVKELEIHHASIEATIYRELAARLLEKLP